MQIDSAYGISLLHAAPHLANYRILFDNLDKGGPRPVPVT